MDHFRLLLSSIFLFIIVVKARHVNLEPRVYWRTILPDTPMPSAIEKLLQPDDEKAGTSLNNVRKSSSRDYFPLFYANNEPSKPQLGGDLDNGKAGTSVNYVRKSNSRDYFPLFYANNEPSKPQLGGDLDDGKAGTSVNYVRKSNSRGYFPLFYANNEPSKPQLGGDLDDGKAGTSVNYVRKSNSRGYFPLFYANNEPSKPQLGGDLDDGKAGIAVNYVRKSNSRDYLPLFYTNNEPSKPQLEGDLDDAKAGGADIVSLKLAGYNEPSESHELHDDPAATLFFLRKDLLLGKNFTVQLADNTVATTTTTTTFIPRSAAESIPFSAADLPSILSSFSIPVGSDQAAAAEQTLRYCESSAPAGETKSCPTSLESMVDFATMSLGTRDVVAVATEGGSGAGERVAYKVRSVRRVAVAGGKGVVSCHPMPYAYPVFLCHATTTTEVYEVEMAAVENVGTPVKAVAVCHTDTSGWNPKHLAFRVLKVKPGTVPVCHFLPQDHLVWAEK